jgi:hypothetical protein
VWRIWGGRTQRAKEKDDSKWPHQEGSLTKGEVGRRIVTKNLCIHTTHRETRWTHVHEGGQLGMVTTEGDGRRVAHVEE